MRVCPDIDAFAAGGGAGTRILAVAGVGNSALGTAAFARNVADAFGEPVAALVSGYGLADMLTEAAGGWMWFGALNRLRHMAEGFGDLLGGSVFQPNFAGPMNLAHNSLDTRTLYALRDAHADEHLGETAIVGYASNISGYCRAEISGTRRSFSLESAHLATSASEHVR